MLKNILFDMGNVILDYSSTKVIEERTDNPALLRRISDVIFRSGEWVMLDAGLITAEDAWANFEKRLLTEEERELGRYAFEQWPYHNLYAHKGMAELTHDLHAAGIGVYILSNAHLRLIGEMDRFLPNPEDFDGILISAEVRYMKPQPEIYRIALERFGILASESLFVDDLAANAAGAEAVGIEGYRFDGDTDALRRYLAERIPALSKN